ncbi:Short-chain dehydrogenase/reductase (SDR) family protein [Penicillium ucsense]|uniref:Short-chain dehydrogenase/reductase (SDR) family protein n=1 Tax=Penicillium ucsense TaxID=2839758 RepID=A0A8J8VWP4_9EURO|nr:Short-chain dehydrogenase/reductase (SDR) family protein [Penicillium ucsense]KAF7731058.1 Short-chain dehydrogenase/reductase (SDR) family protein [Penicillium ucsense]
MAEFTFSDDVLTNLKDQVILITGGSSGIGRATAQVCLDQGAQVVIGDLNPPASDSDSDFQETDRIKFIQVDVTSWESLRNLFDQTNQLFSGIDHVFANAGVGPTTDFLDVNLNEAGHLEPPTLRTINVNLISVLYTINLASAYMKQLASRRPMNKTGSIVLAGSASSYQTFTAGDYTIAKHGVVGMVRGLMVKMENEGEVRLNAIAPSWTDTGMIPAQAIRDLGVPVQSAATVAKSVALLFADENRHGEVIYSAGGLYKEINKAEGGLVSAAEALSFPGDQPDDVVRVIFDQVPKP